jgi:hypothetical protein
VFGHQCRIRIAKYSKYSMRGVGIRIHLWMDRASLAAC